MNAKLSLAKASGVIVAGGLLLAAARASAHHSFSAEFDVNKPITLKGKFVRMDWVNPHSHILLDVTDTDGKVVTWSFEALPPNVLFRQGWRKDSLKAGEEITLVARAVPRRSLRPLVTVRYSKPGRRCCRSAAV